MAAPSGVGADDLTASETALSDIGADVVPRTGVSADDVIACIEMVLGRTPDPALVEYHLGLGFRDRFALGNYMIGTGEFYDRYSAKTRRPTSIFLGDRVLTVTHRGNFIYLIPLDVDLTPSILLHGTWEPHVEQTIVAALRPGDTAIDLGANVGYHTLAIAATVGPTGQVHAFEANPDVIGLLEATLFVNGMTWVGLHRNAAVDHMGTITLASHGGHYGSGHVAMSAYPPNRHGADPYIRWDEDYPIRVDVAATTLDAALADRVGTIDLIHMDIEGSEPLALRGGQALIARSPKIKIITEWSVGMMGLHADVEEYVAWLVEQGFGFWLIEPGAKLTRRDPSVVLTLPHCDLFLSRENPPGQI